MLWALKVALDPPDACGRPGRLLNTTWGLLRRATVPPLLLLLQRCAELRVGADCIVEADPRVGHRRLR